MLCDGRGLEGPARRAGDGLDRSSVQARQPLAPTFAIIALLAVGAKGEAGGFRQACLAGAKTIPAYLVFLAGCYLLIDKVDYRLAILGGLTAWLVVALLIFLGPKLLLGG